MHPFFEGLFLGLLLSVMIGPIFFTLLHTSVEQGFEQGLSVAAGASTSDFLIMSGCFLGTINISINHTSGKLMGFAGVILLLASGIQMIRKPAQHSPKDINQSQKRTLHGNFMKGFLLNSMNPFVFVFWLSIVGISSAKFHSDWRLILPFAIGVILAIVGTDVSKVYLSSKLKPLFSKVIVEKSSIAIGWLFILYSFRLFYQLL